MAKAAKTPAPVTRQQNASEAFSTILSHNFDLLEQWEPLAVSYENIEGVHQTRVAMRRMRSALSVFRSAIPKSLTAEWSIELRDLAGAMGNARDLDVLIDEGLQEMSGHMPLSGEKKLEEIIRQHRHLAYSGVKKMLESDRYARFKEKFPLWFNARSWEQDDLKEKQLNRQQIKALPFSRSVVQKQLHKVLLAGNNIDRTDSIKMHQLRIECKKLRYSAEFFIPVRKTFAQILLPLKALQDLLGVMNDVAVMGGHLDEILADIDDHEILEYAGGIVGWRSCEYHTNLIQFDTLWLNFIKASQRL